MPRNPITTRPRPIDLGTVTARAVKRTRKGAPAFYTRDDGRAYWQARRKDTRETVWTGWATRREASAVLVGMVASGQTSSPRSVGPIKNVGDLMDHWVLRSQGRPDLAANTLDHYEKCARHVVAWMRDVAITGVDAASLDRYHRGRVAEEAAPRTISQEFLILRMAWKWGWERGHVHVRVLPRHPVRIPPAEFKINHHTPVAADVAAVLQKMKGEWWMALKLLATTGARRGEVCALQRDDLNVRNGLLTLGGHLGANKTGPREFPLPGRLLDMLSDRADGSDRPLLEFGVAHPGSALAGRLNRACAAAGVDRFTPQALRRMVVNRMIDSGVNIKTAASLTGHSIEVMLKYYQQSTVQHQRAAVLAAGLDDLRGQGQVIEGPWPGAAHDA